MANWWDNAPPAAAPNAAQATPAQPAGGNWWDKAPSAGTPTQAPATPSVNSPTPGMANAIENGAAQGMTMGFGDELFSALLGAPTEMAIGAYNGQDSGKGLLQRYEEGYDRSLKGVRGEIEKPAQDNPIASTVGNVIGGLATGKAAQDAGLTFLKGSPSIMKGMAEAAPYAFANGYGNSDADTQKGRLADAITSTEYGTAIGGGVGALGKGIGAAANAAQAYLDPYLGSLSRPALNYAQRNLSPDMAQSLQRLGDQSTLADISPEWMGVARGAASIPDSRGAVVQPLLDRQAGANQRLAGDLNASLGPVTPPSQINADTGQIGQNIAQVRQQYGPLFNNATAVDTSGLAGQLDANAVNLRGPAQQATQRVRQMLNIAGNPNQLDPNPGTLFQTRQAIDGMMQTETDPKALAALTAARQQVDQHLQQAVPGIKDVDAQFEQLMLQNTALGRGSQVLDSGKTAMRPDDLQTQITDMAQPNGTLVGPSAEPLRLRQGTRAEIDRNLGTAANDPVAFQRMMKGEGDWNRDKMGAIFGQDEANQALAAGDREALFNTTTNRVATGSDTGMTQGFRAELNKIKTPNAAPPNLSVLGIAGWLASKGVNAVRAGSAERRAADFADQLGRLSVSQGPERDRVINALLSYQGSKAQPLSPQAMGIYNAIIQSGGKLAPIAQGLSR